MTLVSAPRAPRVLLTADDPLETHLLRSLLRALPDPRPELVVAEAGTSVWNAALAHCDVCFLSFSCGVGLLATTLATIRTSAPGLRIVGMLGAQARFGDRAEIVQALQAGVSEIVLLDELSLASLRELISPSLRSEAQPCAVATLSDADTDAPAAPFDVDAGDISLPATLTASAGSWRITLSEQRATFDPTTLERLGYAAGTVGNTLGDWKALIHPDDIDRLVTEVHGVLNGSAPPHPVAYRLHARDSEWVAVMSGDIAVELDEQGAPRAISGQFHETTPRQPDTVTREETPAAPVAAIDAPATALCNQLATAIMRLSRDTAGAFRVVWCNPAAGRLEQRDAQLLQGLRPGEFSPPFDGFDLDDALTRVHQTGIAETREAMALGRGEQPHWRSYHLTRLDDGDVLLEAADISEHVNLRLSRRMQDEMAQYVVRALPLTTLLVDEQGRVVQALALAGGALGGDAAALEGRTLGELFGTVTGAECRQQIQKTLNTGRIAHAAYRIDTTGGQLWLACHSSAVRGRPGMPQRALLTVQNVSEPTRELAEARLAHEQLRTAMRRIPVPLFLKDLDGRYVAINPAFGELYGVEESMLLGKTDLEVFPDELAMELHEADRRISGADGPVIEMHPAGQGEQRGEHCWFGFTVGEPGQPLTGSGCLLIARDRLPLPSHLVAEQQSPTQEQTLPGDRIGDATVSVVGRVEQVLVEAGDYADVLRRLEQLAETTMQAQALIHEAAGKAQAPAAAPLTALAPLAQNIVDLERVLLPAAARLDNEFASGLPLAHCDPLVFQQVLLRGIRHARRGLANDGTLAIRLRALNSARRACISCREGFEGHHVELVIEDSGAMLSERDIRALAQRSGNDAPASSPLDDLAEIHALVHSQGGHLQIQQSLPAGNSLHVFLRAASTEQQREHDASVRSTVTRFPFVRLRDPRNSG